MLKDADVVACATSAMLLNKPTKKMQKVKMKKAHRQLHIEIGDQQLAGATASLCPHGIQLGLRLSLLLSSLPSQVLLCLCMCAKSVDAAQKERRTVMSASRQAFTVG